MLELVARMPGGQLAKFDAEFAALCTRWRNFAVALPEPRPAVDGPMRRFLMLADDEDDGLEAGAVPAIM